MCALRVDCFLLSPFVILQHDKLYNTVQSVQCFEKGYSLFKCGGVWDLQCSLDLERNLTVKGWVMAEKTSGSLYYCSVVLSCDELRGYECSCQGYTMLTTGKYQLCKHPVAILASLDAMRNSSHLGLDLPPKRFKRAGMGVYKSAPKRVKDKVDADLRWCDILHRLVSICPKKRIGSKGYHKFHHTKVLTKKQKKLQHKEKPQVERFLEIYTVVELKEECKKRGLKLKGNKGELIEKLKPYFQPTSTIIDDEEREGEGEGGGEGEGEGRREGEGGEEERRGD
jgi:hypothetical protein